MKELPDRYDFASSEPEIYRAWIEAGCFNAHAEDSARLGGAREPYTIVMPPPNVTAILHVGHGLNNAIQDVIIRWARMNSAGRYGCRNRSAGIAQNVVESSRHRRLDAFDLSREAFVCRTEGSSKRRVARS
jgi:valyl-tRNA synthetase